MAQRLDHLPHHVERTLLLEMRARGELSLPPREPGRPTIIKMLAKGWVEGVDKPYTYRITPAGEAALKAKMPLKSP